MSGRPRQSLIGGLLAALFAAAAAGIKSTFGQTYGANPRSTGNGGHARGNVARAKRAAKKRRVARARASKRRAR